MFTDTRSTIIRIQAMRMKFISDEYARIRQMFQNMIDKITAVLSTSVLISTAFIMPVPVTASAPTTAPTSITAPNPTTASDPATAPDPVTASDPAPVIQIESIMSAFVNPTSVFAVTSTSVSAVISTPVSAVTPALNIQRRKKLKEIRDINLLQEQLPEVKDSATLLVLQVKTRYFCKMNDSFKLTVQEEHIERHNIRLRSVINKMSMNHD
jgi:hypothetical protein